MRKRTRRPTDVNQLAKHIVDVSTGQEEPIESTKEQISAIMREMGRRGGKIGGIVRAKRMTKKERSDSARKAANAKWRARRD